jgi:hypothetical protein
LGLQSLELSYDQDLRNPINSVTYLIRGSVFRPKYATSPSGGVSLGILPLGELIDMYHTHEAGECRDKVFALLGMSSDDPNAAGLSPDYKILPEKLFQRLVSFILGGQVSVKAWGDMEMAVIKSKGCILGRVSSKNTDHANRQRVGITSKNASGSLGQKREWTLQASAKSIQVGDLVCFLQGASKPTIVRICKDHFTIVMAAVTPRLRTESRGAERPELLQPISAFPHDFLLVWDWKRSQGKLQDQEYETLMNSRVPNHLDTGVGGHLDKMTRLWDVVLILEDAEEYKEAEERLRETMEGYKRELGKRDLCTLACMDKLAVIYKKTKRWKGAEELFRQVIRTREWAQRRGHPDTRSSMTSLASTYRDQGRLKEAEKLEAIADILKRGWDDVQITEEEVVKIARSFDEEVMRVLLCRGGREVPITEGVITAAAGNQRSGEEVMRLLLEHEDKEEEEEEEEEGVVRLQRRSEVEITEGVVIAAAGNQESGEAVMKLLLDRRERKVSDFRLLRAANRCT